MTTRVSIVGATGFTGGELIRLLLAHPHLQIAQVTSRTLAGHPVHRVHPNLRGVSDLIFENPDALTPCDALLLCTPHGTAQREFDRYLPLAPRIVDLSADFRLRDPAAYREWYDEDHARPDLLESAAYGLPETGRARLREARLISGVGCNATAMILALLPLARAGLIRRAVADIKVGSSEAGAEASDASHHPLRAHATRTYSVAGHRHLAEVAQELGPFPLDATITSIDLVRGVLCTAHVEPTEPLDERRLRALYREAYQREPFIRIVADRSGLHRFPDPKAVVGSNFADVGFALDPRSGRIIALSAIDNLVKGAAGSAIQSLNIALGLDETAGLHAPGIFPV